MKKIAAEKNYRMLKGAEDKGPRKFTEDEVRRSAFALAHNEGWVWVTDNAYQNYYTNQGLKPWVPGTDYVERPALKEEHYYDEFSEEKLIELYFDAAKERMIETNKMIYPGS